LPVIAPQQSYTRHCPSTPIATQFYHSTKIATQTLNKEIATQTLNKEIATHIYHILQILTLEFLPARFGVFARPYYS